VASAEVRGRRRLAVAVACGALIAGAAAYLTLPPAPRTARIAVPAAQLRPPNELAALAARPATLRPIVVRDGRGLLGRGPAGVYEQARPAPPAWLSIPAASIEAPIDPVHGTATGIEVPAVGRAGWYAAGPRPGEPGRAVIIGHFDASNGPGLFALLPAVANGTEITIRDAAGGEHRFEIVGKAEMEKSNFPTGAVYGSADRPVLVLVTCGGPYTPGVGYRDNVLVYARAV
jgi:hypothetical protein